MHQDASVHVALLGPGVEVVRELPQGRGAYVYVIGGEARLNGQPVATGDAATAQGEPVRVRATAGTELILVDVPLEVEPVGIWRDRL